MIPEVYKRYPHNYTSIRIESGQIPPKTTMEAGNKLRAFAPVKAKFFIENTNIHLFTVAVDFTFSVIPSIQTRQGAAAASNLFGNLLSKERKPPCPPKKDESLGYKILKGAVLVKKLFEDSKTVLISPKKVLESKTQDSASNFRSFLTWSAELVKLNSSIVERFVSFFRFFDFFLSNSEKKIEIAMLVELMLE